MIKKLLFLPLFILMGLNSFSQDRNELRVFSGIADSKLVRDEKLLGSGSTEVKNYVEFGARYLHEFVDNVSLETGLTYSTADLELTPDFTGAPIVSKLEKIELVSIPLYVNYGFWNYFFVNGGVFLDVQMAETSVDSQSGFGYGIGVGGRYRLKNFFIYASPNYKRHADAPFDKQDYHQELTEIGVQFGVGILF